MTLFLYPVDQAVARSTRGIRRTSRPALAVVVLELIILVAVVISAAAITLFGINFLVLTNSVLGSAMPAGSLVVTQTVPADSVVAGDVVTIAPNGVDGFITGRVLEVSNTPAGTGTQAGTGTLTLTVDDRSEVTSVHEVATAQRALVPIPEAGYFLAQAAQPAALGFVLLVALGLVLQVAPSRKRGHHGARHGARNGEHRAFHGRAPHAA